jgi:hypothetical protein
MEELWLQTRKRGEVEQRVLLELSRMGTEVRRRIRVSDLLAAYSALKSDAPAIKVPSRLRLLAQRASLVRVSPFCQTRNDLTAYWRELGQKARRGRFQLFFETGVIAFKALQEVRLMTSFLIALIGKEDFEPSRG